MPHNVTFHQGLQCFPSQNQYSEKDLIININNKNIFLEIVTCDPTIYTMGHPDFIVCSFMENSRSAMFWPFWQATSFGRQ